MEKIKIKDRVLTGDRPTGRLHLGHYLGSLKNRVKLQDEYQTFVLIADIQALTDYYDRTEIISKSVFELMKDYLAVGIDLNKTTICLQSMLPAIHELTVLYMNMVTLAQIQRNPTVKEELKNKAFKQSPPLGFVCYPVSQAADITAFGARFVPVGEDQLPIIELAREVVKRFNRLYKNSPLIEPTAILGEAKRLPGIDGQAKMSKSLNNAIYLSDSQQELKEKIKKMYTDPNRIHANVPGKVSGNPVFIYHNAFNSDKAEVKDLKTRYQTGKVSDTEVKEKLFKAMDNFLAPIREKRQSYDGQEKELLEILIAGTKKADEITKQTLNSVKESMGLVRW